jgi:hypothetical protein
MVAVDEHEPRPETGQSAEERGHAAVHKRHVRAEPSFGERGVGPLEVVAGDVERVELHVATGIAQRRCQHHRRLPPIGPDLEQGPSGEVAQLVQLQRILGLEPAVDPRDVVVHRPLTLRQ